MPPLTRRRALQGAVGLIAGLAGCNDTITGINRENPPSGTPAVPRRSGDQVASDPDRLVLRAEGLDRGEPFLWFAHDADELPTDAETARKANRVSDGLIADTATAETFTIDDDATWSDLSDPPDAVREFVAATDFETETILVDNYPVGACYRLELCHVTWSDDDVETRYGRFLRDHDVPCEADARHAQATVVRLPVALDPDRITGSGTGVGSGHCFALPGERGEPGAMAAGASGTETGTDAGPTTGTPSPTATAEADGGDR
ncbi:hypothetical protein [Halosimplex amylolyticum]|uniref:hypothetical protein n=1 Tax=Halosimplex amylolyticum TaxID=3396616 RepID=UPI003F57EF27